MRNETVNMNSLFQGKEHREKYHSPNPLARFLVRRFLQSVLDCAVEAGSQNVFEVGCGEGHILGLLAANGFQPRGIDLCPDSLAVARQEIQARGLSISVEQKSLYDLDPSRDSAETVICCEVLEHLTDPDAALRKLVSLARKDLIVSVPREPVWHLLNLARGQYWTALGNTPGHFQHWSRRSFANFISQHADIVSVHTPVPWTVIHCRPRKTA